MDELLADPAVQAEVAEFEEWCSLARSYGVVVHPTVGTGHFVRAYNPNKGLCGQRLNRELPDSDFRRACDVCVQIARRRAIEVVDLEAP